MSGIPIPNFSVGNALTAAGSLAGVAGGLINSQATAAGDRAAAQGYTEEANYYGQAATIAGSNVAIEQNTTALQEYLSNQALAKTLASTGAVTTGSGFQVGGSEQYILRSSANQGAIATSLIGQQGAINEAAYQTQQLSLEGESAAATAAASQATAAANAASSSGILGALGGIFGAASKFF